MFLSSKLVSGEALFVLSRKNIQDQRSVALGNINAHTEKESPQRPFCRTKIEVKETNSDLSMKLSQVFHSCLSSLFLPDSWTDPLAGP